MKIQNKHIEESRVEFKEELDAFSKKLLIKCSVHDVKEGNCPWANVSDLLTSVLALRSLMIALCFQEMSEEEL